METELVNPAREEFEQYINKPFDITQDDIDTAIQKNSFNCVLAVAIKRFIGDKFENVVIHPYNMTIGFDDQWKWFFIHMSKDVQEYIKRFDNDIPIQPMTLGFLYTGRSENFPDLCFWYPKGHTQESISELTDYYDSQKVD